MICLCNFRVASMWDWSNYVGISTKSFKDVYDVGHVDFVTPTLSMTFLFIWAVVLALILVLIWISARKLKRSTQRRIAGRTTIDL